MTTYKDWYNFFAVGVLLASNLWADSGFKFSLTPSTIELGQRATLEIYLKQSPSNDSDISYQPEVRDHLLTDSKKWTILDKDFEQNGDALVWRYEVTTYEPGKYTLPPVEVVVGPSTYSTESLNFEATTMREKDDNELRPEFGPVSAPLPWRKATIIILLGIAAALIARKMANMRRRWPWESSPPQLTINLERGESYESWLARELETLRNSVRSGADSKESLARLSQAIRGYFSRRYVKPAEAWTTLEFQKHLISDERAREVSSWMVSWDGARFSATASLPNLLDQISNVEKLLVGRQEAA